MSLWVLQTTATLFNRAPAGADHGPMKDGDQFWGDRSGTADPFGIGGRLRRTKRISPATRWKSAALSS
jgi:hypothetical protein